MKKNIDIILEKVESISYDKSSLWLAINREKKAIEHKIDKVDDICYRLYDLFKEYENNPEAYEWEVDNVYYGWEEYNAIREAWSDYSDELDHLRQMCEYLVDMEPVFLQEPLEKLARLAK